MDVACGSKFRTLVPACVCVLRIVSTRIGDAFFHFLNVPSRQSQQQQQQRQRRPRRRRRRRPCHSRPDCPQTSRLQVRQAMCVVVCRGVGWGGVGRGGGVEWSVCCPHSLLLRGGIYSPYIFQDSCAKGVCGTQDLVYMRTSTHEVQVYAVDAAESTGRSPVLESLAPLLKTRLTPLAVPGPAVLFYTRKAAVLCDMTISRKLQESTYAYVENPAIKPKEIRGGSVVKYSDPHARMRSNIQQQ